MRVAIGSQVYLPYTQSWIYRQMIMDGSPVSLVICNETANLEQYPFPAIETVSNRRSLWRKKVLYKLQPVLKYFPFRVPAWKAKAYEQALRSHRIDVLHVHFGVMAVEFMDLCARLNIPLVVTFHGFDITAAVYRDPSYHRALKKLFLKMRLGIAISHEMKERLIRLGCPEDKIEVSYLGVPVEEFEYSDRLAHGATVKFLHAGRFSGTKGVPDLVRAFSMAFSSTDPVELYIAGDGEERDQVREAVACSSLKDNIRLLGKVSDEQLKKLRRECDVFVLNCRTPASGDKEGLPIALLEASCCGLPIVTTRHAGIAEGVLDECTGLLVDEYDTHALAAALKRMTDRSLRLKLGLQGRQWMEEQFELAKCSKVLKGIYDKAFNKD